jgi:hypothetical protein
MNNRFALQRPERSKTMTINVLRPGTEVELLGSGIPPIRGLLTGVHLSAGGYRVVYSACWWDGGHRFDGLFEPKEIGEAEPAAGNWMAITL